MPSIQIKRIYEKPAKEDGYRILVDRLWPRGMKKENAPFNEWIKSIAPSAELRKWFDHQPERFPEFEKRYKKELKKVEDELDRIKLLSQKKNITLLYSAKNREMNQAVVLKNVLTKKLQ